MSEREEQYVIGRELLADVQKWLEVCDHCHSPMSKDDRDNLAVTNALLSTLPRLKQAQPAPEGVWISREQAATIKEMMSEYRECLEPDDDDYFTTIGLQTFLDAALTERES